MATGNGYRDVLAIREARALISASAGSQVGDWLYNAALLGYVYSATGSAGWVGAATICRLLPYAVLGPIGGVIADRYNRRTVLIVGDLLRCALMAVLAIVVANDGSIGVVIALTALASAAGTAERPAAMSWLPRLVGVTRLGSANALLHTVQQCGIIVGPAIGAIILAVGSASSAFAVNAATFGLSAALVSTIRRGAETTGAQRTESPRGQLRDGFRIARTTRFALPLFVVIAIVEFTYGAQTVQLVLYAERIGFPDSGYGYLLAAAGVGGVLSAFVNGRLATSWRVSIIVVGAGGLFCATQLVYAGTEVFALALAATVIGGGGLVSCEVVAETALARVVPSDALGRLMGVLDASAVAAMVVGALVAPTLVDRTSLRISLIVLGVVALAIAGACLLSLRGLDALSRGRADALASRMAVIQPLPIVVGVSQFGLEQLASAAVICPLPSGVDVVVEGAPAHAFYVILDGEVIVHRDDHELNRLGPGGHFGERGLLDAAPRNASVTTAEPSSLLRLEGDVLLEVLQSAPTMRSVLDRSNGQVRATPDSVEHTAIVDDPEWGSNTRGAA